MATGSPGWTPAWRMALTTAALMSVAIPPTASRLVCMSWGLELPAPQFVVPGTTTTHRSGWPGTTVLMTEMTPVLGSSSFFLRPSE